MNNRNRPVLFPVKKAALPNRRTAFLYQNNQPGPFYDPVFQSELSLYPVPLRRDVQADKVERKRQQHNAHTWHQKIRIRLP